MAKTIHTVLYDDVLEGSRIVTMDNCVCQLYDIKRDYEAIIRDSRENLSKPALYVLLNRKKGKAYIGETDDFSQRIASHMLKKEFWDEALAFMANDNSLTTTEVRYLESLSYEIAKAAGTYDLTENTQIPKRPYVQTILGNPAADFSEAGIELKCTPLKKSTHDNSFIKERLVCNMTTIFPSSTIRQHEFPRTQIPYTTYSQTNLWNHHTCFFLTNTRANGWNVRCHQGNGNIAVRHLVHFSKLRASAPS